MNIGQHCAYVTCGRLDFLPFTCELCKQVYCKDHRSPDSHECHYQTPQLQSGGGKSADKGHAHICSVEGCGRVEQVEVLCYACQNPFCLSHRHPHTHKCPVAEPEGVMVKGRVRQPVAAAAAGNTSSGVRPRVRGVKSSSLSVKVAHMRMKQTAQPLAPVPDAERVYYSIVLPGEETSDRVPPIYLSLKWSIGKAVDLLAVKFHLENNNDKPGMKKLHLFSTNGTCLQMRPTIQSLLDIIPSGSSLRLSYEDN